MSKYSIKKNLATGLCCAAAIVVPIGGTYGYFNFKANQYINDNQLFNHTKVIDQIDFWGGDIRYIDQNYNNILFKPSPLSTHLNVGDRPVNVGYSLNVTPVQKEQFDHVFKYINEIFETINPKYKFTTSYASKDDCDIFIEFDDLRPEIGANVETNIKNLNASRILGAHIRVNNRFAEEKINLRFYLAHEMLHVLYGSNDVNYFESKTFSVYNANDVGYMISRIDNSKIPTKEEQLNTPDYMTQAQKNSFITYTPTDLSTLIAIYGNPTKDNSLAYLNLLNKTQEKCKILFGSQPFYESGYELPTVEELQK